MKTSLVAVVLAVSAMAVGQAAAPQSPAQPAPAQQSQPQPQTQQPQAAARAVSEEMQMLRPQLFETQTTQLNVDPMREGTVR